MFPPEAEKHNVILECCNMHTRGQQGSKENTNCVCIMTEESRLVKVAQMKSFLLWLVVGNSIRFRNHSRFKGMEQRGGWGGRVRVWRGHKALKDNSPS